MFDETFKSHVEVGQFFFMQYRLAYYMTSRIYDLCSLNVSGQIPMVSLKNKFSDASWGPCVEACFTSNSEAESPVMKSVDSGLWLTLGTISNHLLNGHFN